MAIPENIRYGTQYTPYNFGTVTKKPAEDIRYGTQYTPYNFGTVTKKPAEVDTFTRTGAISTQEFAKEPTAIEKFFNALFSFLGNSSTEEIDEATKAIEELAALREIKDIGIDKGYQMHQAMRNDPTTKQYSQYDREIYAKRDENTFAFA